ncbi:50S ribosomal protein L7/L12 [Candidatus Dojkabacteria bacterium]|nr:50S ribosomal protein L7/L12 [Candidatus Dojkabacteria bacterium]
MAKLNENQKKVLELVEGMSVLELADLVSEMEEKFGVSAAAPVAVAAAPVAAEPEEEKTTFNVVLADVGANKINVIKAVREIAELGLVEAKNLVEKGPGAVIKEEVTKDEAAAIKAKVEEAGGKVDLK